MGLKNNFNLAASTGQRVSRMSPKEKSELIEECLKRLSEFRRLSVKGKVSSQENGTKLLFHILQPSFLIQGFDAMTQKELYSGKDESLSHEFDLAAKYFDDAEQMIFADYKIVVNDNDRMIPSNIIQICDDIIASRKRQRMIIIQNKPFKAETKKHIEIGSVRTLSYGLLTTLTKCFSLSNTKMINNQS